MSDLHDFQKHIGYYGLGGAGLGALIGGYGGYRSTSSLRDRIRARNVQREAAGFDPRKEPSVAGGTVRGALSGGLLGGTMGLMLGNEVDNARAHMAEREEFRQQREQRYQQERTYNRAQDEEFQRSRQKRNDDFYERMRSDYGYRAGGPRMKMPPRPDAAPPVDFGGLYDVNRHGNSSGHRRIFESLAQDPMFKNDPGKARLFKSFMTQVGTPGADPTKLQDMINQMGGDASNAPAFMNMMYNRHYGAGKTAALRALGLL